MFKSPTRIAFWGFLINEMTGHLGNEIQLVGEFWILLAVRHVTASWNVEIMYRWAILNLRTNMPAVNLFSPILWWA